MSGNCLFNQKTTQPKASRNTPRKPAQARGQERRDAILDAAAALVAEKGIAGMTMHTLAARAQTSIGSLYHFFRDREEVVDALFERHATAIRKINEQICSTADTVWSGLTPDEAIDRLVVPYVDYLGQHDDYLPVMHQRALLFKEKEFIRPLQHLLRARLPQCDASERESYAMMLHLIAAGTMHAGLQFSAKHVNLYIREIPRALAAYLTDLENRFAVEHAEQQKRPTASSDQKKVNRATAI
ncbi:TetR/AcrR family transcriptional regulator [uncultured Oxalicibacterium sp.]|uniref:TetR/AcrR family transcriptional regulator n=1 Tax=uncultured Oxalicibacterium sp. TaxID=1168540 RepID=UPI0025DFB41E|nr:TetR/AcrR family transcriptional regulator [uncultured Oxalicibacterium sp.]